MDRASNYFNKETEHVGYFEKKFDVKEFKFFRADENSFVDRVKEDMQMVEVKVYNKNKWQDNLPTYKNS